MLFVTLPMGNRATSIPSNVMPTVPTNAALDDDGVDLRLSNPAHGFYAEGDSPAMVSRRIPVSVSGTQPIMALASPQRREIFGRDPPDYAPPTIGRAMAMARGTIPWLSGRF